MEQSRTINLNDYLREIQEELRLAELRLAELRGQRDLLLRLMQQPQRTDGEEPTGKALESGSPEP